MSYIAALPCREGFVLVADTQETYGDHKQYAEKIAISEDASYPLAIGGAGVDEVTEAFAQELLERVIASPPQTQKTLRETVKCAIEEVYSRDMVISALPKQMRTAEFLVAAKPPADDFAILRLRGRRVYSVPEKYGIIGYATAVNKALLKRMFRPDLTMHRAVLLASYLVTQSKNIDSGVGGETRIALVSASGAYFDDKSHIANVEKRANEFIDLMDDFFLRCTDLTASAEAMGEAITLFGKKILELRQRHLHATANWFFLSEGIQKHSSPYAYLPPGSHLSLKGDGSTEFSEDISKLKRIRELYEYGELQAKKLNEAIERQKKEQDPSEASGFTPSTSETSEPKQ